MVSILVLLETALIPISRRSRRISIYPVSILVLLETALILQDLPPELDKKALSFQSLFYWKLLSYFEEPLLKVEQMVFQSLFYWKLLSYWRGGAWWGEAGIIKFQSLFYWKLLSYLHFFLLFSGSCNIVSILVLLETALILSFPLMLLIISIGVSILVLLETALIRKGRGRMQEGQPKCFNPCFIGNCSHTKKGGDIRKFLSPVSILVLLETALIP